MISLKETCTSAYHLKKEGSLQDGLLILDSTGSIIQATPPAEEFFDISVDEMTGKKYLSLFPYKDRQPLQKRLKSLKPNQMMQQFITKEQNGELGTYVFTVYPILIYNHIHMVIVTLQDITLIERLRIERDLSLDRERTYKENISHHFFNPLAIAKGYLQLALNECDDDITKKLCPINTALERIENKVKSIIKTGNLEEMR